MAEFGNGLAEESLLDSDPGHPELEDPGVGDEEPGLEEGEAAIEDPVSEGHCLNTPTHRAAYVNCGRSLRLVLFVFSVGVLNHMPCALPLSPGRSYPPLWFTQCSRNGW